MERFTRITRHPGTMGGKACIRGLRITVSMILGLLAAGHSMETILAEYPYLEREDLLQALRYAARQTEECELVLATA